MKTFTQVIEWDQPIYEQVLCSEGVGTWSKRVGVRRMRATVEVKVDLDGIFGKMGRRACENKTGRCKDGFIVVKAIGQAEEISRTEVK